jgi:hypothetical protein
MENIMENGVTAEKSRVQSIKEKYPKKWHLSRQEQEDLN